MSSEELLHKPATPVLGLCDKCVHALLLAEEMARVTSGQAARLGPLDCRPVLPGSAEPFIRPGLEAMIQEHPHVASRGPGYKSTQCEPGLSPESQMIELLALDRIYKLTAMPASVDVNALPSHLNTHLKTYDQFCDVWARRWKISQGA